MSEMPKAAVAIPTHMKIITNMLVDDVVADNSATRSTNAPPKEANPRAPKRSLMNPHNVNPTV